MRIKTLVILILLLIASNLSAYLWPVEPQDKQHGINATLGEWRVGHFHAGVDINESLDSIYCPATSIVDTTELKNNWIGRFRYIHVILDTFEQGETLYPGDNIGYINGSHLHFRESSTLLSPHDALNPLLSGALTPYVDYTNPHIDSIKFYRQASDSLMTGILDNRVDILSVAGDTRTDTAGHSAGHNVSVYRIGYEINNILGSVVKDYWERIRFDTILDPSDSSQLNLTYGSGSSMTHFRYWVTNDPFNPDSSLRNWYWNTKHRADSAGVPFPDSVDADSIEVAQFKDGHYWVKIFAYDIRVNADSDSIRVRIDNFPPKVYTTSPFNGQIEVSVNSKIRIIFTEAIDTLILLRNAIEISPGVSGDWEFINNKTIEFTPDPCFIANTVYTVTLKADSIRDFARKTLDGNRNGQSNGSPIDDYEFSFKTSEDQGGGGGGTGYPAGFPTAFLWEDVSSWDVSVSWFNYIFWIQTFGYFEFPFYGETYNWIYFNRRGSIWFDINLDWCHFDLPSAGGSGQPVIAVYNDSLRHLFGYYSRGRSAELFNPRREVVRWTYTYYADTTEFEAVLFEDGTIRFDYRKCDIDLFYNDGGSGISSGNSIHYFSLTDNYGPVYELAPGSYIFTTDPPPGTMRGLNHTHHKGPLVKLFWLQNPEPDLAGYNIYRRTLSQSEFQKLNTSLITSTDYNDSTIVSGETYIYVGTAVDTLDLESAYSNPDTVRIIGNTSDNPYATAFGRKITRSIPGKLHIVWAGQDSINYIYSFDDGFTWSSPEFLGVGTYPNIAVDSNGKPNVVWMWYSQPGYPAESRLYFSRKTPSGWTTPDTLWKVPTESGVPCFTIDESDTGRVVWDSYTLETEGYSAISFGTFYTQAISPAFYDTIIDDDYAPPGCKNPSIAIDSTCFVSHVVYSKDNNIYYTIATTSSWTTPRRISDSSGNSLYPYIEYDKDSGKLHVVWQQKKGGKYQIMHCAKGLLWPCPTWPKPVVACSTGYNSVNPVITGGEYVFWSEEIPNNSEIYYSRYNGISWGDPVLVKNTPEASMYPQVTHTSGADSDTVFVAWTDGDSLPYTIEFQQLNFAKTVLFSGHISENITWSSDILIKGDVWVDAGVTLTIDAGVNVKFIPNFDDEHSGIDPTRAEFIIQGGLVLMGNDSLSITFTSNAPHPEIGDWYGIRFVEAEKREYQVKEWESIPSQPTESRKKSTTESTRTQEPQSSRIEEHKVSGETIENKLQKPHFLRPVTDKRVDDDFEPIEKESKEKTIEEIKRQKRVDEKKDANRRRNIHYLEIEYAKTGLTLCEDKMLSMKNCAFKNNEAGLKLTGKSNVSITNSVFEDNTIYGIFIGEGVTGDIKDCTVSLNCTGIIFAGNTSSEAKELDIEEDNTGGNVSNISNLSIRHSRIINNYDYGIYITNDAEPDLGGRGHNYIYGSGLFDLYNNTDNKIMAKTNYWGTKDTDTVKEHIYDYYDDNSLGIVEVEPLWEGEDEKGMGGEMLSGEGLKPLIYSLRTASPNPFVNNTTMAYSIAKPGNVSLNIYDISGRLVKTLINEKKDAGVYSLRWNGSDDNNRQVAIGVYFTRLTSGDFTSVKKVILVR